MRNIATDPGAVSRGVDESAAGWGEGSTGSASLGSRPPSLLSRVVEVLDRAVARALRVRPQQAVPAASRRPLETPLLLVGVRCTARYVVLPFVLPLLGVAGGATRGIVTGTALGILLLLDVIAAMSIVATLRWLWRRQHPRRWQYLPAAVALMVLVVLFLVIDTRALYA